MIQFSYKDDSRYTKSPLQPPGLDSCYPTPGAPSHKRRLSRCDYLNTSGNTRSTEQC